MNRSNTLLWVVVIVVAGFVFWMISTGKLDLVTSLFMNGFWRSIQRMILPIFHR